MAFKKRPKGIIIGMMAIPFIGKTTKNATAVGPMEPKIIAFIQKIFETSFRIKNPIKIPHKPPKNDKERKTGTPKGYVGFVL